MLIEFHNCRNLEYFFTLNFLGQDMNQRPVLEAIFDRMLVQVSNFLIKLYQNLKILILTFIEIRATF